ncbi:MAG: hypothetical protein NC222_06340 [Staphylococcus sp.]|nr:hypothetical protein [Staphylococcus sp.]
MKNIELLYEYRIYKDCFSDFLLIHWDSVHLGTITINKDTNDYTVFCFIKGHKSNHNVKTFEEAENYILMALKKEVEKEEYLKDAKFYKKVVKIDMKEGFEEIKFGE